jgi:signal transduction histidine kinase
LAHSTGPVLAKPMHTNGATLEVEETKPSRPTSDGSEPDAVHACRILIIDDEEPNVLLLERVLARAGFVNFLSTTDPREAATLFIDFEPDLVLTDWLMPEVDGREVIAQLRDLMATDDYLPIVVLTADVTAQAKKSALTAGATDFLTKPFDQIEVMLRVQNLLQARLSHLIIAKQNAVLEESVRRRTIELERTLVDLQRTQKQVIQQERLAALGTLTGGIAHDFNNAISIIMGFGEVLLHDIKRGVRKERATEPLTAILAAAQDAAKIVHRLREFYHPEESTGQHQPVDLNRLINQAILLTQPRWQGAAGATGRTITMNPILGQIPNVVADPAELREMLTNLIFNAVDAMPQGGTIAIRTRDDGQTVTLNITDTGTGMTEEVRRRCLEPFFTTKGKGGTGFGLSMVFGIVQRLGGTIEIKSQPGHGTDFEFRLPAASAEILALPDASTPADGVLRILVVDDLPILSQLVCEYLKDDLHIVETALSGSEALEKFTAADFDLVITGQLVSGISGDEMAITIKQISPKTPVIFLTGYAGDSPAPRTHSAAIDLVLEKPVSRSALRQALAGLLVR